MPKIPGLIFTPATGFSFFFSGLSHVKFVRLASIYQPMQGNQRQSWILDSAPWILDSVYWIPDLSVDLDSKFQLSVRCRIPTAVFRIGRPRIPDSTSKNFQDSGYHVQKFPGFLYMWRIYASNQFCMCILIPSTMLYFEYWIVHHYLSHWMDANYTS